MLGIRVVDATTDLAGHLCARLLADAGASVARFGPGCKDAGWASFVGAGLQAEPDSSDLADATSSADILLVSTIAGRGTGLPGSGRRNDQLVVHLPPFGAGPYDRFEGGEVVLSALCGLTDCTPGYPDWQTGPIQPPVQSWAHPVELGAAVSAAIATFGAIVARLRGEPSPTSIEVSQLEAAAALMVFDWGPAAYVGDAPGRRRNGRLLEPNLFIPCQDGYLVIVGTNDAQWQSLSAAMGSPAWASDPRFATILGRAEHKDDLHRLIIEWARTNSGREFATDAQARGVPCAFVLDLPTAIRSEQVEAVGSMEIVDGTPLPADPIVRSGRRRSRRSRPMGSDEQAAWFGQPKGTATGQPLRGIRVLDVSQLIAGPLAGQYLASLGADVLIVESRRHPTPRMYGPFVGEPQHDGSSNFNHANRGKRSVELDLKTAQGRAVFRRLVRQSDVVLENFSRRAATDLGITDEALRAEQPELVLASISAFGRSGPWGGYTANHAGVAALSGLADSTRGPDGEPHLAGGVMPDVLTGAYMALGIVEALAGRLLTGRGAHVEVSMLDVILNAMGGLIPALDRGAWNPAAMPATFYRGTDGAFLAIASPVPKMTVGSLIRGRTALEAMSRLQGAGIGAAVVQDMLRVLADPHLNARDFVRQIDHPVVGTRAAAGVPWVYDGVRPALGAAPVLGSDTAAVMSSVLGMPDSEIRRLQDEGVLR